MVNPINTLMNTKTILLGALIAISLFACKEEKGTEKVAQEIEEKVIIEEDTIFEDDAPILLGSFTRDTLESAPYNKWFIQSYKDHAVDENSLSLVKEHLKDASVTVFMGTWCEDSQREVPAFFKILDEINYESDAIKVITISEEKDEPAALLKDQDITNVPTFVFSKNGTEMGRIVEYPLESLEKDMIKILSGADYQHAYETE